MAFPLVSGGVDYSSSGLTAYIPAIYSTNMLLRFHAQSIFPAISNTDYEGEISGAGDKVYIPKVGAITVRDYVKGQALTYETPKDDYVELLIDKGKYWGFKLERIDKQQTNLPLNTKYTDEAGKTLQTTIDTEILAGLTSSAASYNKGIAAGIKSGIYDLGTAGAPITITPNNLIDYVVYCGAVLDEANIPFEDRYIVMPVWMNAMFKRSELKEAQVTGDGKSIIRDSRGKVGLIDRFTVYASNNLPMNTSDATGKVCHYVYFGQKSALTFAEQLTESEVIKDSSFFGDFMRGLMVYGWKIVRPESFGCLYVTNS